MLGSTDVRQRQIFKFDATLKLVGNSIFSNGDLIFIDPKFAGAGAAATIINTGIGGYYYVYKVNHTITSSMFETEISAKWNSFPHAVPEMTKFYDYFARSNKEEDKRTKKRRSGRAGVTLENPGPHMDPNTGQPTSRLDIIKMNEPNDPRLPENQK